MTKLRLDPIDMEIGLHRLWQITEEMGITLTRTSGSIVTIDSKDYMTALYDSAGNCITSGCGVIFHTTAFASAVKFLMHEESQDSAIEDGDVFILNDPYVAALHQADVAAFAPIFYDGQLVAWSATMTHKVDIGGIDPGGSSPSARNVFQEGLRFKRLKLVERGRFRRDVFEFILNCVRDPGMVGMDMKAQLAAGETARQRLNELIDSYGLADFKALCRYAIQYAEDKFRARLRELPDGVWSTVVYQEGDGVSDKIYQASLTMTKKGERLTFDFTGTSEQAPCSINSTANGAPSGVFGAIAPLLCYDMPWNQGIMNLMEVVVPEGTILNAKFPAPCSTATTGGCMIAFDAALITISEMLSCSEEYKEEATAQWSSSSPGFRISGVNKDGKYFVTNIMENLCGGGGATRSGDGVDVAGKPWTPQNTLPNVESLELQFPIMYLYRRMVPDSGGAGKFRGGAAGELAMVLHDNPEGVYEVCTVGMGYEPLQGYGLCGSYPSHNVKLMVKRGTDIQNRLRQGDPIKGPDDLPGVLDVLTGKCIFRLGQTDVLFQEWNGGGGYGDPLDRAPELVKGDVSNGLVSTECAWRTYGVALDQKTGGIDTARTLNKRRSMRRQRLAAGKAVRDDAPDNTSPPAKTNGVPRRLGEYLQIRRTASKAVVRCEKCGRVLCDAGDNYKQFVPMAEYPLTRANPRNSRTKRFVLREFYCPGCSTQIDVEMALKGAPLIWSYRLGI
ncbi:MAG: hydantoinase B/oxoprolinase family protein [Chloroflexi bacterium]|nr:hydantoinase B/oxoprolinase family protein [Chloroflexota bacterium]